MAFDVGGCVGERESSLISKEGRGRGTHVPAQLGSAPEGARRQLREVLDIQGQVEGPAVIGRLVSSRFYVCLSLAGTFLLFPTYLESSLIFLLSSPDTMVGYPGANWVRKVSSKSAPRPAIVRFS